MIALLSIACAGLHRSIPVLVPSFIPNWQLAVGDLSRLAYQSIGVIYGDIGTSPLYVYSSTFSSSPSRDDLLGVLSLIIWTVTLMVINLSAFEPSHCECP